MDYSQQAKGNEEAQERVTRREQTCSDTFLEHYLRPLIFQACGLPEPHFWSSSDQLLMDSRISWRNYRRKIFSHMVLYFPFDSYDALNCSIFWVTPLLFMVLDPNKLQKLFLIHLYGIVIFIWMWKLLIKTWSGLISFWKVHGCSNIPNHLPSSSPYFSYYNDLLSLIVKDFIFVSWGS